jgi:hypothetical protein
MEELELSARRTVLRSLNRIPGTRDDRIVFRRGHKPFDYFALGEFFGAAGRGVSDRAGKSRNTPVESQTKHKNEYGRA